MFMKQVFNANKKLFSGLCAKNFSTSEGSLSMRFHELYVKELERIQHSSYVYYYFYIN